MGQIKTGIVEGEGTYKLKVQKKYDGSDHKQHDKGKKDIQPENGEWV